MGSYKNNTPKLPTINHGPDPVKVIAFFQYIGCLFQILHNFKISKPEYF